jgi:hypothetical protein
MNIFKSIKIVVISIILLPGLLVIYMLSHDFMVGLSDFQRITNNKDFHILESQSTGFMDPSLSMHFTTTPELMDSFIVERNLKVVLKTKSDEQSNATIWLDAPGSVTYYENTDYIESHQEWMDYKLELRHNKSKTEGFYSSWSM